MKNYFFLKNSNRRGFLPLCLLLLFSICSYGQQMQQQSTTAAPAKKQSVQLHPQNQQVKVLFEETQHVSLTNKQFMAYTETNTKNLAKWKETLTYGEKYSPNDLSYIKELVANMTLKLEHLKNNPATVEADKTIAPDLHLNKTKNLQSKEDLIMKEVVSIFNQNNQLALAELKSQDVVKYTSLMNSLQDIYKLEKEILLLSKTSHATQGEKSKQVEQISLLKKELAKIKNQYSLK